MKLRLKSPCRFELWKSQLPGYQHAGSLCDLTSGEAEGAKRPQTATDSHRHTTVASKTKLWRRNVRQCAPDVTPPMENKRDRGVERNLTLTPFFSGERRGNTTGLQTTLTLALDFLHLFFGPFPAVTAGDPSSATPRTAKLPSWLGSWATPDRVPGSFHPGPMMKGGLFNLLSPLPRPT